jgi:hypothetical protein
VGLRFDIPEFDILGTQTASLKLATVTAGTEVEVGAGSTEVLEEHPERSESDRTAETVKTWVEAATQIFYPDRKKPSAETYVKYP